MPSLLSFADSADFANPQPPADPADVTAWRRSSRRKAVRTPRRTLQAPPPAGGSIDRIASAVGRSVLFVRIFGSDHPFPFLSFPFLSFPFLSFPFPRSCLRTFIGARSAPPQESFRRCTSGTSDPVRRTAVLTARDAGAGMFERFSSAGCPRTSSSRDGVSVPGRAGERPHATLYLLCLRRPRVGALSSVMTYLYLYMAAEEAPATVWHHRNRCERAVRSILAVRMQKPYVQMPRDEPDGLCPRNPGMIFAHLP